MYETDGDFGRVRLTTRSQFQNYDDSFICIRSCGWHHCNDKYRINRLTGADSNLILYTVSGMGEVSMNGKLYKLLPSTAIIIKEKMGVSYYTQENGTWEFYWIHFKGEPCAPLINLIYRQTELLANLKNNDYIKTLTEYALYDKDGESLNSIIKVSDMLSHMLHNFIAHQAIDNLQSNNMGSITKNTMAYIHNNYHKSVEVTNISNSLYISCEHLIRVFKKDVGLSPYAYLCKFRIEKAKELLRLTNISVEKISRMVGFRSHSNFSKQFKTTVGVTPATFRKGL